MPDIWTGLAGRTVADHELTFFCEIDGVPLAGPRLTMAALAQGDPHCWPPDQREALSGRHATEPVWVERAADDDIGDFHPHVSELLNGRRPDLMRRFEPSPRAARLLAHADLYPKPESRAERTKKRIEIRLSAAARGRVAGLGLAARQLLLTFASLRLHVFATGKSLACVTVTITADGNAPNALELLEAQNALGRIGDLAWIDAAEDGAPLATFALLPLIVRLARGNAATAGSGERISSFAFARVGETTTAVEADFYALHLARHYTTDYLIAPTIEGVERVGAFETVRTAVANEGAATVIVRPPGLAAVPPFLEGFRTVTLHRHYLPIALLALHERAFLIDRTSRAALDPATLGQPEALETLRGVLSDALTFRLHFRFTEVSYVSMHNEIGHAFRRVMSLDRLLRDLGEDVAAIEAFLSVKIAAGRAAAAHATERRFYWTSILGAMALSGLTTFTILKEATETFAETAHPGSQAAVIAGILVAIATLIVGFLRRPVPHAGGGHDGNHFTDHAATEHMIHRAMQSPKTDRPPRPPPRIIESDRGHHQSH